MNSSTKDYSAYAQKKLDYLQQIVEMTEDFIGRFEELENPNEILEQRQAVMDQIAALDADFGPAPMDHCKSKDQTQIRNRINLILALDNQCVELLETARNTILSEIKNNHQGQQVARYTPQQQPSGRFLDYKK